MNGESYSSSYLDVSQHWSAISETYAGGDVLVTYLQNDWIFTRIINEEKVWFGGNRKTTVYHVELYKDGLKKNIPVLENPYIKRIIATEEAKQKVLVLSD